MARTKGSKNIKKSQNIKVLNLSRYVENTPIIEDSGYDFVNWGKRNDFPYFLLKLYINSPIHSACVDFLVNGIVGNGIDYDKMSISDGEIVPNAYETWDELLRKLAFDLVVFNSFAIQIIKNKDNKTYSFFHQPFSTVRLGKKNEDGEIKKCYLCQEWKEWGKYGITEIEHLNYSDNLNLKMGKPYLMTYIGYNAIDSYYGYIPYTSIFNAIQADIKMTNFDLKSISNNFTPNGCLVLNQIDDEQERRMIINNVQEMFTDADNANNLMITFRNGNDDTPIEYIPFQSNASENVNIFSDNNNRTTNRIVSGHKIASKTLIGLSLDGNGFNSEADYLESAYKLTEKLTLTNLRNKLINSINVLFALNGIEQKIILKSLDFSIDKVDIEKIDNPQDEETQIM